MSISSEHSTVIKASSSDAIAKSNELIKTLFSVVNECHSCKSKLIKMVGSSDEPPPTPTGHTATQRP